MGIFDAASSREVQQLHARVARLERLVETLARQAGVSETELAALSGPQVSAEVRRLALEGKKVQAIKELRAVTGMGLKEAKDVVEAL